MECHVVLVNTHTYVISQTMTDSKKTEERLKCPRRDKDVLSSGTQIQHGSVPAPDFMII